MRTVNDVNTPDLYFGDKLGSELPCGYYDGVWFWPWQTGLDMANPSTYKQYQRTWADANGVSLAPVDDIWPCPYRA